MSSGSTSPKRGSFVRGLPPPEMLSGADTVYGLLPKLELAAIVKNEKIFSDQSANGSLSGRLLSSLTSRDYSSFSSRGGEIKLSVKTGHFFPTFF